ncbi:phosphatase PAP2 family protein [Orbus wheelerorum]|uniref:phosphatase PAP2 family protein n=1 Tax=Orbus wheelerorum TaxID=3074111 RepID=UPI00370D17AC
MTLTEIDTQLFLLINAAQNTPKLAVTCAIFCAQYLIYLPIFISFFYWFKYPKSRETITKIVVIVITTLLVTAILRSLISSSRPFDLAIGTNFLPHSNTNSFPSKHASVIFAITFALFYATKNQIKQKKFFIGSLLIAILISWARVYLGVHWPLDILAAILISFICAYFISVFWLKIKTISLFLALKSHIIILAITNKRKITK